jgi:hypothetical protein
MIGKLNKINWPQVAGRAITFTLITGFVATAPGWAATVALPGLYLANWVDDSKTIRNAALIGLVARGGCNLFSSQGWGHPSTVRHVRSVAGAHLINIGVGSTQIAAGLHYLKSKPNRDAAS